MSVVISYVGFHVPRWDEARRRRPLDCETCDVCAWERVVACVRGRSLLLVLLLVLLVLLVVLVLLVLLVLLIFLVVLVVVVVVVFFFFFFSHKKDQSR